MDHISVRPEQLEKNNREYTSILNVEWVTDNIGFQKAVNITSKFLRLLQSEIIDQPGSILPGIVHD